ncbi:MAG TPA: hypothetical protein VGF13_09715, partial [Verrucomicrobiae bacterium]
MNAAILIKTIDCIGRRPHGLSAVLLIVLLCGCTHFHDQKNEELAKDALKDFNDFRKTSGGPYGIMLRNHAKMDVASAAFQAEVAKVKAAAIATELPRKTWSDIHRDLIMAQTNHQGRSAVLAKEVEALAGLQPGAKESVARIEDALK